MWSHWLVLWGELCPTSPKPPRRFGILGVQQVFRDNCLFVASEHPIPCPYGSNGLVAFDWNHLVSVLKLGWLPFVLAKALFLRWFIAMFGRWISHLYVCIYICDYMCVCAHKFPCWWLHPHVCCLNHVTLLLFQFGHLLCGWDVFSHSNDWLVSTCLQTQGLSNKQ
jgi:hypothetical protein